MNAIVDVSTFVCVETGKKVCDNYSSNYYETSERASDKVGAQFSTPQLDRKNRVNGSRRMSDGQTNGMVGKVDDRGASNAKHKVAPKLELLSLCGVLMPLICKVLMN
ncbi:hypothetical protein ANCCEY_08078 [Ancylostoma ceylanicum]|uniref:Uncharacterized protein n=1 Tax=Ancylostoma ceylanicum TaxID=53326 RepID=A0A0D6LYZ3_9BILA|nr:hypothetical protein ANCCEY_08078 [Ancylostoma ceylanicum]